MTKPTLTVSLKRILITIALVVLCCGCMTVAAHAENAPTGFIFPTLPTEEPEEAEESTLQVESVLPGPRTYALTLNANGSVSELESIGFQSIPASDGDTGWVSRWTYASSSWPKEGTVFGLTGWVYTFEKPGEAISGVKISLPAEPVEGMTYRITAADPDTGLGLQINDLICCGCVQQTETRVNQYKKYHFDSWSRSSYYTNETEFRKITNCFHYTGALTDAEDYFTVTVESVHSAYVVLSFEGRLYGGINEISGEFCCRR